MAMFAMGATLHVDDFRTVVRLPRSFLTGLGAQMVLVPLVAFGLLRAVDLDPGVAIGLAIIAAVPGGTVSNVFTYAGTGDVALSIALTLLVPLAIGMAVLRGWPDRAERRSTRGGRRRPPRRAICFSLREGRIPPGGASARLAR
jgi:predicted Na+-dependent transporter